MKKIILSIILMFLVSATKAQVIDSEVESYLKNFAPKIDTFLIYTFSCNGGLIPFDTCAFEEPQYLFWTYNSNSFLKKFDYCRSFKTIQIDTSNPLSFYISNKKIINNEKIRQPTYYEIINGKKIMTMLSIDHSCYHQFKLHTTSVTKSKSANIYDLDFIKFDNGRKNIFYNYNQKTKFKLLIDKIEKLIKKLEAEKRFKAE